MRRGGIRGVEAGRIRARGGVIDRRECRPADRTVGLRGGHVERPGGRRPVGGAPRVVAHREVLGVVPQPGHAVAVVVVHDGLVSQAPRRRYLRRARGEVEAFQALRERQVAAGVLRVGVLGSLVGSELLGGVVVILVAGQREVMAEAQRVRPVRVVGEQRPGRAGRAQLVVQAVDRRRPWPRVEGRLPCRVRGERIGPEVVIERDVLIEDHHKVLDRSEGTRPVAAEVGR